MQLLSPFRQFDSKAQSTKSKWAEKKVFIFDRQHQLFRAKACKPGPAFIWPMSSELFLLS